MEIHYNLKIEMEKKLKMKRNWIILLFCTILLTGCSISSEPVSNNTEQTQDISSQKNGESDIETSEYSPADKKSSKKQSGSGTKTSAKSGKLEVHFIDVGQGDSILITIGSHAMLIDAGDNTEGTAVQLYLNKQGIKSLDYVIGTHPDSDHIGGLDVVIYKFDCKKILMPDCQNSTTTYRDVLDSMKSKGYKAVHPKTGEKYSLGDASFTVIGPVRKYKETNDNSISLRLVYQDTSFLFMGDTTADTEPDVMAQTKNLRSDVLKIAHHGSKYSTTEEFFERVQPEWAVISCAEDNHYGFPSARVLNLLRSSHTKVFRTDEQGSLVAESDGSSIRWNASPSTTWKSGENTRPSSGKTTGEKTSNADTKRNTDAAAKKEQSVQAKDATYIINTNSNKFHKPDCGSVKQMSENNTEYTKESRENLIKEGYSPCGSCNP